MGILSKLTSTASSSITIGTVLAKTASLAAVQAMETTVNTTKLFCELAFTSAEDFVKVAEEVLEQSGVVGDKITNIAYVSIMIMAKVLPSRIGNVLRMLNLFDEEAVSKFEDLVDNIVTIIETGDLQVLEDTIEDILEAGLFGVTVLQPNILLAIFMLMQVIVTGSVTLVKQDMMGEEEASNYARNICAKIWRIYGEVYHGQEWYGFENIPDDGGLIIYYHGVIPVDYFGLVAKTWTERKKVVHSVVDRSLMQIPNMDNLRNHFKLFAGTVDSCADILKSGELLGIAPGGAYESLFGDANYPVLWQSRVGFAKVAIKANKPIIPVFTENIRENTLSLAGRMSAGRGMWEYMYKSTKLPCVPMYGLFPVKLRTHIGTPIYPTPDMTPEDLSKAAAEAVQKLISQHQILPGNLTQALAARMDEPGKLSRASSGASINSSSSGSISSSSPGVNSSSEDNMSRNSSIASIISSSYDVTSGNISDDTCSSSKEDEVVLLKHVSKPSIPSFVISQPAAETDSAKREE